MKDARLATQVVHGDLPNRVQQRRFPVYSDFYERAS